ncbi:hypothetical protein [Amycolatopsis sp. CA-126428]|uniref:hypothetical protein n=1 Tax=Amycolatopsis sp. CA-126428 TaxID=2073158 RepID=UPI0011B02A75|nr:hypothetical protein [Amycolatopsis sp. CA-126428]
MPEGFPGPGNPEQERAPESGETFEYDAAAIDEEVARRMSSSEYQEYLKLPSAITREELEATIRAQVVDEMAAEEARRRYGWESDPLYPFEPGRDTSAIDEEVAKRMNSPEYQEYLKLPSAITREELEATIRAQVVDEMAAEETRQRYGWGPGHPLGPPASSDSDEHEPPHEDPRG